MNKVLKKRVRQIQNLLLTDQGAIKYKFHKYLGKKLDLENPRTFNEKLQWLKLNDRTLNHKISADKYLARNLISEYIGEKFLVPLEFHTKNVSELSPENFPDHPVIIKANHDCGGSKIIYNKSTVDWDSIQKFFSDRLKKNYYFYGREWQYKDIERRIIVERLLLDENGNIPFDYKMYCFNGKVKIIAVDKDRGLSSKSRNWYDLNWNKEMIFWNTKPDDSIIEKPEHLDKVIELSERISKKFHFLRVDWYIVKDQLYCGELTLHPGSGFVPFEPEIWDEKLGDYLKLPIK